MKKAIIFIMFCVFITPQAFAGKKYKRKKKEPSPVSGSISISYGKGFDLFSEGSISTSFYLAYDMDKKTRFHAYYSYKNDLSLSVSRDLYKKKKGFSFKGGVSLQAPISKASRDNDLITSLGANVSISKKLRTATFSLSNYFAYKFYGEEADADDSLTQYYTTNSLGASFSVTDKISVGAGASWSNVWDKGGERTEIRGYSANAGYSLTKEASVSFSVASSSETLAFDPIFDDENTSYRVQFTLSF